MVRCKPLVFVLAVLALAGLFLNCGCSSGEQSVKPAKDLKKSPPLPPEALEHFRQAHRFLAEQKTAEALKEFQETARLAPDSSLAVFWLGKAHLYNKDRDQAEKHLKKVLEMDPENYHAMATLGRLYSLDRDKLDQAEAYLKQALDYSPDNLEAHFDLARIYARKGERDKALQEFRFLFNQEAEFFIYHFELGRILEAWGNKDAALQEYRRAHLLNPKFEPALQASKRLESAAAAPAPAPKPETPAKTPKPPSGR
ncbi:MAG: tetratricopeptide repeat protein [Desulfobaccales bacterium]